jgi:CBS domain-containing protein
MHMLVRDGMSKVVLTIGPAHTLREAARLMTARQTGAAVVIDPDTSGIGILTERDVLISLGSGQDPDRERAGDHLTSRVVYATPSWTLYDAAVAMTRGGFRHLVVLDHGEVAGIISERDLVRHHVREVSDLSRLVGCGRRGAPGRRAGAPGTVRDDRGTTLDQFQNWPRCILLT